MKKTVILGTGGFGRFMSGYLLESGAYEIVGFTEADKTKIGTKVLGIPVIGDDDVVVQMWKEGKIDCAFLGLGETNLKLRAKVYTGLFDAGISLPGFVHPAAIIASTATIEDGSVILPLAYVGQHARIGRNVFIGCGAGVDHDNVIGDHVYISAGTVLGGSVHIGDRTLLGLNCTVFPAITVGADAKVGAGSVVSRDIPANTTVVAAAARPVPPEVAR
jgi:sugar O-acyltransferase (sialic acid O-acetyltransferase NeuD family)